jgi:hypothetical protein
MAMLSTRDSSITNQAATPAKRAPTNGSNADASGEVVAPLKVVGRTSLIMKFVK